MIQLQAYGPLSEIFGSDPLPLEDCPAGTVGELLDWLHARHPALAPWRSRIACAIDNALVGADAPLPTGTTVDLIPPVSGG